MEFHATNFFCHTRKQTFDIKNIRDVRCFKKGHEGVQFYTVRYVIQAEFKNQRPIKILESQQKTKMIKQMVMIKNFIGLTCTEAQVRIFDESTRLWY